MDCLYYGYLLDCLLYIYLCIILYHYSIYCIDCGWMEYIGLVELVLCYWIIYGERIHWIIKLSKPIIDLLLFSMFYYYLSSSKFSQGIILVVISLLHYGIMVVIISLGILLYYSLFYIIYYVLSRYYIDCGVSIRNGILL